MVTKTKVSSAEETVKDIRRETRRKWNAEEKIRIVLEGLRDERYQNCKVAM
jgi:transposase-like protein